MLPKETFADVAWTLSRWELELILFANLPAFNQLYENEWFANKAALRKMRSLTSAADGTCTVSCGDVTRPFNTLSEAANWIRYGFFDHVSVCAGNPAVLEWFASNWRLFGTASTHLSLPSCGDNFYIGLLLECYLGGHIRIERTRNAAKEQTLTNVFSLSSGCFSSVHMLELRGIKLSSDELLALLQLPISVGKRAREVYVTANCIDDGVDHLLAQLKDNFLLGKEPQPDFRLHITGQQYARLFAYSKFKRETGEHLKIKVDIDARKLVVAKNRIMNMTR